MIPLNPRELKRTLKRLGINVEELSDATLVVIETRNSKVVIEEPHVMVITSGNQKVYQIVGKSEKVLSKEGVSEGVSEFSEDDVKFVMEQAGVSRSEAINALREAGGDIAKALLIIEDRKVKG